MGDIKTYNIGNIENAQFINQSLDYQDLIQRIEEKQEMVEIYQQTGKTDKALKAGAELEALEKQLEQFKENVLRLYDTFSKIEINSERLAKAKAYFDQGQFREADAILNAVEMTQDLDRLIERDRQLDHEKAEIAQGKTQIADEFLIKARLQTLTYDQPDWFEQACQYFEKALTATRTVTALFEYAVFLQNHNSFDQAKPLYEEALELYRTLAAENPRTYLPYVANTLNNLANLQSDQNHLERALASYDEALELYRTLAAENPRTYLPNVAGTLNNLGLLQSDQNHLERAQASYDEALQIRRTLAAENPRTYLPYVARTLNNLAILQQAQNHLERAQASYDEALQIQRTLAAENPRTYLPDVAMTLINLSIFYLQAVPDQEKSIAMALEVLEIFQGFQNVPIVGRYAAAAIQVLEANGVDMSG
jgi:tetratricopeptide (TPR) repeat protein